jgi:hypothetical protein
MKLIVSEALSSQDYYREILCTRDLTKEEAQIVSNFLGVGDRIRYLGNEYKVVSRVLDLTNDLGIVLKVHATD